MRKDKLLLVSMIIGCLFAFTLREGRAGAPRLTADVAPTTISGAAAPEAEWTVMIFMNGDNNLENDALTDFREIARVGSNDKVNVIVQFDRNGHYPVTQETDPKWTQTLRFRVTRGMEPVPKNALADIGEANMGDGKVLADFVTWAKGAYPAKHYLLDIWDHGQGWRGIIPDSATVRALIRSSGRNFEMMRPDRSTNGTSRAGDADSHLVLASPFRSASGSPYRSASLDATDKDQLYNREIQDSLTGVLQGQRLDVLGFDACLMAMVETGYAMRNIANVLVGSEELVPGTGWQYDDWIGTLENQPSMDAVALGKLLVDSYRQRYSRKIGLLEPDRTTTQSAIALSRMDAVAASISAFADRLAQRLDTELDNIRVARNDCAVYAPNPYGENPARDYFYHIDFVLFCNRIIARAQDPELKAKAAAARDAVLGTVLNNYAGDDRKGNYGSNGVAIYFPATGALYQGDVFAESGYEKTNTNYPVEFVQKHTWGDFLHAYFARVP